MSVATRARRSACRAACIAFVAALAACSDVEGPIFVGALPRDGRTDAACAFPGPGGRLGEFNADGDTANAETCSPWRAEIVGGVPYGPSPGGQAWAFRSMQTSPSGDPNYVKVTGAAGLVLPQVTLDVRVRQVGFNRYAASNRFIVGTGWKDFTAFKPGEFALYLHENGEVYFFARVGTTFTSKVDWGTAPCENTKVAPDAWVRFTGTYDGVTLSCYRDGRLASAVALPRVALPGPISDLVVGRNYPGDVDALRVLDRVLAPDDLLRPWPP